MIPKSTQNRFKNLSKNEAQKINEKTAKINQKWRQKATQEVPRPSKLFPEPTQNSPQTLTKSMEKCNRRKHHFGNWAAQNPPQTPPTSKKKH